MNQPNQTNCNRILIVDDNPAIHEDYRKILLPAESNSALDELGAFLLDEEKPEASKTQYDLQSAFQGQEAHEMVKESLAEGRPFAMAFVDMRMPPGWNGLQTIQKIWEVDPRIQVVICTAFSDYSWSEIVERIDSRDRLLILKKPFDNIEVCQLAIALTQKWGLERQAESRMSSIVETAPDAILSINENGLIESCNSAACSLLGCERQELTDSDALDLIVEPGAETWRGYVDSLLQSGAEQRISAVEIAVRKKSGDPAAVFLSLGAYHGPNGARYTVILSDLSDYKKLQQKLAEAQKLESVGQLAAGVAHEINTPMQFICSNLEFLQTCTDRIRAVVDTYEKNLLTSNPAKLWRQRWEEVQEALSDNQFDHVRNELPLAIQESLEGAQRVVEIIRAMKEFTHPGQQAKTPLDLNHAIEGAVTITRNHWRNVAQIDLQLDRNLPQAYCAGSSINQAVLNLIVNAIDAIVTRFGDDSGQQGAITIRTYRNDGSIFFQITDNGCGIEDDIRGRIFDPFFTTKEVGQGTGQGLSLIYNTVVKSHGGAVEVESTPGVGSTFTVRLPLGASAELNSPTAALPPATCETPDLNQSTVPNA